MTQDEILEEGRPYNCGHGKGAERRQDGGVARSSEEGRVMSLERRGHAEFDSFDREVRQGRRYKTFHHTARTEAKDIP